MAGLYLHIPFCKQACHYCDFHFSTSQQHRPELIEALISELALQKDYLSGETIETIYFGGGTPSLLTPLEIQLLMDAIAVHYPVGDNPEVTLEANPDDLDRAKLAALRKLGVNRLSIGIQSFDDRILQYLNRAHDSGMALQCISDARAAGFDNISIDLIYAIPGQDIDTWERNISQAILLQPEHLSSYSLTIEEKTAFGKWQKTGKLTPVDEEATARQFELLMEMTATTGYQQYEISNFSKPGFHSRHNSSYWKQQPYLGIGPSAHSYDRISRQFNVSNNAAYANSIREGRIPFEREVLTRENQINEYIFTTLRTVWGCEIEKMSADFGFDLIENQKSYLDNLQQRKLAVIENNVLRLTSTGRLLADKIAADLFVMGKDS